LTAGGGSAGAGKPTVGAWKVRTEGRQWRFAVDNHDRIV